MKLFQSLLIAGTSCILCFITKNLFFIIPLVIFLGFFVPLFQINEPEYRITVKNGLFTLKRGFDLIDKSRSLALLIEKNLDILDIKN